MNVIIIDDEPLARQVLIEYLEPLQHINILAECNNGFEGVKAITELKPDLIFLDVQMPKLNGFEMLELLDQKPKVIFTTAFDEYAIKAFEVNAIDYLLKPFTAQRLNTAIEKANTASQIESFVNNTEPNEVLIQAFQAPRIVIKDNHQIYIIPFSDILYLEAADDYVKIFTEKRYYLKKKTMTYFESILPQADFCRVHRSFILKLSEIAKVEPWEKDGAIIITKNKTEIPVSKAGYVRLKKVLGYS
jgi:two-component system, LytTR family, response regulator